MTITEKIKNSIHAALDEWVTVTDGNGNETQVLVPFPVYYHDDPAINMMTSGMDFPCAILRLLTQGYIDSDGQQWRERVTAAVFFVDKSDFDFDADDNEVIIEACKIKAEDWLSSLNMSSYVDLVRVERTSRVYDQYDDILTGFGVMVELKEVTSSTCVK